MIFSASALNFGGEPGISAPTRMSKVAATAPSAASCRPDQGPIEPPIRRLTPAAGSSDADRMDATDPYPPAATYCAEPASARAAWAAARRATGTRNGEQD